MGGLKPIGSEKLVGMDKIRRIMEIARYNEILPSSINENEKNEYSLDLADGNTYHIVKERLGYIIKKGLNESTTDYIDPMKNRKYFSSYSQALKKINLMAKEFNVLYENVEGTSLFNEEKKKYKLKLGSSKKSSTPTPTDAVGGLGISAPAPVPAPITPAPASTPMTPPMDMGGENKPTDLASTPSTSGDLSVSDSEEPTDDLSAPPMDDTSMGEKPMDSEEEPMDTEEEPMDNEEEPEDNEEEPEDKESKGGSSFKFIQKLTGKLAQKIRTYSEDSEIDSKDAKYILNSILSAIDVDSLDEDDVDDIIARLEGEDEDEDENMDTDTMDDEEEPIDNEEEPIDNEEESSIGSEESVSPMRGMRKPPMKKTSAPPMGEIGETMSLPDAINKSVGIRYNSAIQDELGEDLENEYPKHGSRFERKPRFYDDSKMSDFEMFGESKVDKIISKYFEVSSENIIAEKRKKISLLEQKEKNVYKTNSNIRKLSENIKQERSALKFMEKYPNSKLLGKTNKGNLVFEEGFVNTKITTNGTVI
jgi:hypothetical protein